MSITLFAKPEKLTPAYNQVMYMHDSTNKSLPGFKYIYDIYQAGTLNKIAEYRVLPIYSTGYGRVDLSKLLQSQVTFDLNLNNTTVYNANDSFYKYDVKVGEEYVTTTQYSAALTQYLVSPYVGRVQINVANTFVVGDQISITQTGAGATNPTMEGLFTVLVADPAFIVINVFFSTIVNVNKNGDIIYADGRRTVTRDLLVHSNQAVFNGVFKWSDFPSYLMANYDLADPTDLLITNHPNNYYATLGQDIWFHAFSDSSPGLTDFVYFENDAGEIFRKSVNSGMLISGFSVGPNNHGLLTPVSGSLPLIKPTTENYYVYYERAGVKVSKDYYIYLDRRVRTIEYQILFLDRMGSWNSFAFTGRDYERGNITRTQYNQYLEGRVVSNKWTYDLTDRGYINTQITTDTTIDLNSNYMTEEMAAYFVELLSSPMVYIKKVDYSNDCDVPESTEYVSCNIVTSSFEVFKTRNKRLIKQSLQVKLANNNMING